MTAAMKKVGGTWLPETETHMVEWMEKEQQWHNGRLNYQLHKQTMALARIPKDRRRVALDIGSHVGTWAMNLIDHFAHVHCFEPSERADILPHNMRGANFTLHRVAIGDAEKNVAMQTIDWSTGGTFVIPDSEGDVPMRTLDSYNFPLIDFIKIDVEGQELPLVRGATETILRTRPFILIEQKGWNDRHVKDGSKHALAALQELGMTVLADKSGDYLLGW